MTVRYNLGTSWTEITECGSAPGDAFLLSVLNGNVTNVDVAFSASQPTANAAAHKLNAQGQFIRANVPGKVWARANQGAVIAVSGSV